MLTAHLASPVHRKPLATGVAGQHFITTAVCFLKLCLTEEEIELPKMVLQSPNPSAQGQGPCSENHMCTHSVDLSHVSHPYFSGTQDA